jgi:hypothetical protein
VGVDGVLATKHPKKHQNGYLPGVNNHLQTPATDPGSSGGIGLDLNCRKYDHREKKPVGRISEVEKFGSRKCHSAMTQAFSDQMECLGAL